MSYNGVGLSTPRGSGTSGHIQANRSHLRPRQQPREAAPDFKDSFAHRPPDQGILDHERKRRVEAQCFELQVSLEDDGVEADEIERQVSTLREKLLAQSERQQQQGPIKQHERHQLAAAKEQADARMRAALGIKADHQEGAAFDRELQEQLKQQRIAEREQAREERARIQKLLEADREKAQRERDAQGKRHEEDMRVRVRVQARLQARLQAREAQAVGATLTAKAHETPVALPLAFPTVIRPALPLPLLGAATFALLAAPATTTTTPLRLVAPALLLLVVATPARPPLVPLPAATSAAIPPRLLARPRPAAVAAMTPTRTEGEEGQSLAEQVAESLEVACS
ncbi:RNA-splicing factor [Rhodotorula toruloides]